jgi:uncharacterized membrane-anchored protein YhcB (DUF1043 family)
MVVGIIIGFVAGFVIGALVFRNNTTKANAVIATVQADTATVVADAKKV